MPRRRTCAPHAPLFHPPTENPSFLDISSVAIPTFVRISESPQKPNAPTSPEEHPGACHRGRSIGLPTTRRVHDLGVFFQRPAQKQNPKTPRPVSREHKARAIHVRTNERPAPAGCPAIAARPPIPSRPPIPAIHATSANPPPQLTTDPIYSAVMPTFVRMSEYVGPVA